MSRVVPSTGIADFDAVRLAVASSSDILKWSHGEVTKPETINYRTQKPERDGLFCERIFGPVKDINPHDSKLKGVRSRETAVDKNGELVTKSIVRRERMGHIELASPVAHIWFMRGTPSAMSLLLGMTVRNLERVAYFASYVVLAVDTEKQEQFLADLEAETEAARAAIKMRYERDAEAEGADVKQLAEAQSREVEELNANYNTKKSQLDSLVKSSIMSENDYRELPEEYEEIITRHDFMKEQMDDLKAGKSELLDIINTLYDAMTEQFKANFIKLQENFTRIFSILFEGGRAYLEFTDPTGVLEGGIELVAQPPGKRLRHISLLSGGEKSMVAIALLFSFLEINPSPFCVIDEVDAALDDHNIYRYITYLKKVAEHNQFITITHRRTTLEVCDNLYGVSMSKDGVSQLVSVRLTDYA